MSEQDHPSGAAASVDRDAIIKECHDVAFRHALELKGSTGKLADTAHEVARQIIRLSKGGSYG